MPNQPPNASSFTALLVRLFWMLLAPPALFIIAAFKIQRKTGEVDLLDLLLICVAIAAIAARYCDTRFFNGQTATGEGQATLAHWRAYALTLAAVTAAALIGVRLLIWLHVF